MCICVWEETKGETGWIFVFVANTSGEFTNLEKRHWGVSGSKEMTYISKDFTSQGVEMQFCKKGNSPDWTLQFRPSESQEILRAATVLMPHFVVLPG